MKNVIAFATISACLLVLSGGAALANGSGHPNSKTLGTGQPGGTAGAQCGTPTGMTPPPGQAGTTPNGGMSSSTNSPFLNSSKAYAGSSTSNANPNNNSSAKAFSNYDVACSQLH